VAETRIEDDQSIEPYLRLMWLVQGNYRNDTLVDLCEDFAYEHLPEGPMRETSLKFCELAVAMLAGVIGQYGQLEVSQHKVLGAVDKLIEAKDRAVRLVRSKPVVR
jgi:hypothetical protein